MSLLRGLLFEHGLLLECMWYVSTMVRQSITSILFTSHENILTEIKPGHLQLKGSVIIVGLAILVNNMWVFEILQTHAVCKIRHQAEVAERATNCQSVVA